jgi:hypothetical protein
MNPFYPLFKTGAKQKLSKDFDQFDRDHAPLYQQQRFNSEYNIARHELEQALQKVGPMDIPEWEVSNAVVIKELERRKKMIMESDRLKKDVHFILDKMEQYSTKVDEKSKHLRQEIADHVASILPEAKEHLVRIDATIQSELNRLSAANTQLIVENTELRTQAGASEATGELRSLVDKMREKLTNRELQDETELKRLRIVEAEYLAAKQSWAEQKDSFEKNETKLDGEFNAMREKRNKIRDDLKVREEELKQAIRSKDELEAKFGSLLQEKKVVDELLAAERERVKEEKQRADSLSAGLGRAQQESEERRRQIEELQRQMAVPRSLDAGGREHMELFSLRQEAANWNTWRTNRIAEVETLKAEKEELRAESADRQTQIDKLKEDAQFAEEMERQLVEQISELRTENEQLGINASELESDVASKDTQISKLERKERLLDNNFEWVKGRYLEYYGMYQISNQDNQRLREMNAELGEALQRETSTVTRNNKRIANLRDQNKRLEISLDGASNSVQELSREKLDLLAERDTWNDEKVKKDELIGQMRAAGSDLLREKEDLNSDKTRLGGEVQTWKNLTTSLEREKADWENTRKEMEASAGTLTAALHQAKEAWKDQKQVLELQLEGSQNVAIENWVKCASAMAEVDLQAREFEAQVTLLTGDLQTRTAERDSAIEESATKSAELDTRTEERDTALQELELVLEGNQELADRMKNEFEEARVDLQHTISDLEEQIENMVSKEDYEEVQSQCELQKTYRAETYNAWLELREDNGKLRREKGELQKLCDSKVDPVEYRRVQELCKTKRNFETSYNELQQLCESRIDPDEHKKLQELCDSKVDLQTHQQLQGLCNNKVDREEYIKLQQLCDSKVDSQVHKQLQKLCADKVDRSQFNDAQQQLQTLRNDLNTNHNGACVKKERLAALERRFKDLELQHAPCGDKVDRSQFNGLQQQLQALQNDMNANHSNGECVTKDRVNALQLQYMRLQSQHTDGACVDRSSFNSICQELQQMKSQHADGACVDQSSFNSVQEQLQTWQSNHGEEHCVTKDSFTSLERRFENLSMEHQDCTSPEEVQRLLDFQSQHGTCVDRVTYDNIFNEHQGCEKKAGEAVAAVWEENMAFRSEHADCISNNTYAMFQQEHRDFVNAHADCEGIAAQLGQLQEEHGQCARRLEELRASQAASGQSAGQSSGLGPFRVPPRPGQVAAQGSNLRVSTSPSPGSGYTSPYARDGTPSPSGQGPSPATSGHEGQSQCSPAAGTSGQGVRRRPSMTTRTSGQRAQHQSPTTAGTSGPPPQQPTQSYTFLVSGDLVTGQRTLAVDPSLFQMMNAQIARWESRPDHVDWSRPTKLSHKRCADTRVFKVSNARNPPASENPNVACSDCVKKRVLCTLVGDEGPVVVPLPLSERSPGATPTNGEYYVKEKRVFGAPGG